eukprot:TRINITY_DN6182_c0_g3_i2.p1 TRINITY_DN6182_c0_g3~~TRINITY_DN6182_c0_g3_i2.p1  ORF type:complete len:224 (-),score=70.91 TRINITY_DN6182_c0_g3_i2:186-857(-)
MEKAEKLNVEEIVASLKQIGSNLEQINVHDFTSLCLHFTKLSSSMGRLVAWGFQDIFSKCGILENHAKRYPELPTLQLIVEKEISQNIHVLSGNNNDQHPQGHVPPYNDYESAARTILRLLWFLTLIRNLLRGLQEDPKRSLSSVGRKAYNESIAPYHPFFLRNAIRLIFYTVPSRKHFVHDTFGEVDPKTFNAIVEPVIAGLTPLIEYLWKYYGDREMIHLE